MSAANKWRETANLADALAHGLTAEEFKHICEVLGRDLIVLELGICSALFSEHCSYKSTKVHLKNLPTTGPRVLQGPGENAGVVDIGDGQAVVFKIESHNHPSFIEPFQGAATGVGGILRDVFTMGARPIALLNALRFGDIETQRNRYLLSRAVAGIGGYGNCMGIPTVGGELWFHESYDGNCLVNAFALGLVDADKIFLGSASGVGNSIMYIGSKTGRDGIHGATMASESFEEDSEEKRPTVQVGDPFQEKLLLEACLEVFKTGAVVGIQDMGAAGMTSSTYEMADRAQTGVRIDLDKVPQREDGMNPYEIMLSESQERMLLVVTAGREQEIVSICEHWELSAVKIGEVVTGNDVTLCWNGEAVSEIPVALLTSAVPQYRWPEEAPADYQSRIDFPVAEVVQSEDLTADWMKMLSSPNLCCRWPVYQQYDSTVRTNTVVHPGGDAAVVRVKNENGGVEKGVAMTLDCNSRYCSIDPRQGTALSLAEAFRNISAVGALPLALSDCLNFGSPQRPEGIWQIAESIRGMSEAAKAFETPIISGNVSLYNETKGKPVYPTPMLALVGLIDDASKCVTINFKNDGDVVYVAGPRAGGCLGGSEYLAIIAGVEKGALPIVDYEKELACASLVRALISERLLNSCHDISAGGLAMALAECCFGEERRLGVELKGCRKDKEAVHELFSEEGARYVISCSPDKESRIVELAQQSGIDLHIRGIVGGNKIEVSGLAAIELESSYKEWRNGLCKFL